MLRDLQTNVGCNGDENGWENGLRGLHGNAAPFDVGIVGAGQLARMTVQAAASLGVRVRLLAERPGDSAALIWPDVIFGRPDSRDAVAELAGSCRVLTFDHELVDAEDLAELERRGYQLAPSAATVAVAQDKWRQRTLVDERGLPAPPFRRICTPDDLRDFGRRHGWPVVVKAARGGYDGRGVWILESQRRAGGFVRDALAAGTRLLAEARVPIERELAVLVARRRDGETVHYPVVETVQVNGICHEVLAPAHVSSEVADEVRRIALAAAEAVDLVGLLAVEMFLAEGRVTVNELAARPHNSAHYTIEGCVTSQFENLLRAILDLPLGSPHLVAPAVAMANVLATLHTGDPFERLGDALTVPGVHVHLYQKEPRPGRKIGHVTALGDELKDARARATRAAALLAGAGNQAEERSP